MAPRKRAQAKLDVVARKHLYELQAALQSHGLPPDVDFADILSALVLYTSPAQLAGMLAEYWRYTARLDAEAQPHAPGEPDS